MKFKLFLTLRTPVVLRHRAASVEDEWDSTFAGIDRIALTHAAFRVDIPRIDSAFTGTGDLTAALLLAHTEVTWESNESNSYRVTWLPHHRPRRDRWQLRLFGRWRLFRLCAGGWVAYVALCVMQTSNASAAGEPWRIVMLSQLLNPLQRGLVRRL